MITSHRHLVTRKKTRENWKTDRNKILDKILDKRLDKILDIK